MIHLPAFHFPACLGRAVVACAFLAPCLQAATFTVTNSASSGPGSFREAISQTSSLPAGETLEILFDAAHFNQPRVIVIDQALATVSRPMILNGPPMINGGPSLTLTGDSNGDGIGDLPGIFLSANPGTPTWEFRRIRFQHFVSEQGAAISQQSTGNPGALLIEACSFFGNRSTGSGGAAYMDNGTLTLNRCIFDSNLATGGSGGAIIADTLANLDINRCTFIRNSASNTGGAVQATTLIAANSWFHGNSSAGTFGGGGVRMFGSSEFRACTFSENIASAGGGGAIRLSGSSSTRITSLLENCTFSKNETTSYGGAIHGDNSLATLRHCTITGNIANRLGNPNANIAGGGLYKGSGINTLIAFELENTLVAENVVTGFADHQNEDLVGSPGVFYSVGGNLIGIGSDYSAQFNSTNDVIGSQAAPLPADVGPLQFNGGFTPTRAPFAGSLAINGGNGIPLSVDQRGQTRPSPAAGASDKGAVEFRILNFNQWAALHLLDAGEDGQLDDPDQDGIQNLIEYYTGSDPARPSPSPLRSRRNGNTLEMDYPLADHTATGSFQPVFQGSVRFVNWHTQTLTPTPLGREGNTVLHRVAFPATTRTYFGRLGVTASP
ncbi:MAG: hypothetical protein RLZ97_1197 [Verrucomicrobiota bacterium]|jgi:predicted outer membrane repeat protein